MKKSRQLHLWIGLLTSLIILVEAISGFLLLEPWLMGVDKQAPEHQIEHQKVQSDDLRDEREKAGGFDSNNQGYSIMGFVKNLHAGRIGNTDVSILLDVIAVSLIVLTITGMYMSIKILRAQGRHNRD